MAKDYAHRTREKKTKWNYGVKKRSTARRADMSSRRSLWIALFAVVILISGLIAALLFIQQRYHGFSRFSSSITQGVPVIPVSKQLKNAAKKTTLPAQEPPAIKFDFYNTLPNMKIDTSNASPATNDGSILFAQNNSSHYVLQLASLNSQESAVALQEEISKKGFRTKILPIVRGQTTWYRLQIGPFPDQKSADAQQAELQQKKIPSILVAN